MRRIASVLALVLVASLAISGVALAAGTTETTFKMEDQGSYVEYSGKVSSNSGRCVAGRKVNVFHNGVLIATATTGDNGTWSTTGPKPPDGDAVTAKVKRKKKGGKTICKGTQVTKTFQAD